ncbi:hypothetical protein [Tenacibaculum ovolyticum]|uniref:hypothetical protein n=1 Tax=Tenacibaculum ovolyticum TaxID=104270 RepID=UPI0003F996CB|nr:hypothetical protein [Tenacibaculum ovolyticum]
MNKNMYLNTGIASLLAFTLLLIMNYTWPLTEYSLNDVLLNNVSISGLEKESLIKSIGINYALDTVFIFSWIGSWIGIFLHFKSLKTNLIDVCFGLSFLGALLDITENSISFSLLIGNNKNVEGVLFIHSIVRDISFWLPMVASFMLVFIMPKMKGIGFILLKLTGIIGVLFAILGMYIQFFSVFPYYWFMLWFFAATIFLFENLSKRVL